MFMLRLDIRAPFDGPADIRDLYDAAVEMSVSGRGPRRAVDLAVGAPRFAPTDTSRRHSVLAAAIAPRTSTVPISVATLLVPLHDPVHLAEDMAMLDGILSRGHVLYVLGLGYHAGEYEMFGRSLAERGRRMDECLTVLRRAWSGQEFDYEGRTGPGDTAARDARRSGAHLRRREPGHGPPCGPLRPRLPRAGLVGRPRGRRWGRFDAPGPRPRPVRHPWSR